MAPALSSELKNQITLDQAWFYNTIPHSSSADELHVLAKSESNAVQLRNELEIVLGRRVKVLEESAETKDLLLQTNYPKAEVSAEQSAINIADLRNHFVLRYSFMV